MEPGVYPDWLTGDASQLIFSLSLIIPTLDLDRLDASSIGSIQFASNMACLQVCHLIFNYKTMATAVKHELKIWKTVSCK